MSFPGSRQCRCPRFVFNPTSAPEREWVVVQRNENRSSYNGAGWDRETSEYGPHIQPSKWSHVLCIVCGAHWRTQAGYVDRLPDLSEPGRKLCYAGLRQGKPAGKLLLAKIRDVYNRPLFRRQSSPSRSQRARTVTDFLIRKGNKR